jgi:hypothetical protein
MGPVGLLLNSPRPYLLLFMPALNVRPEFFYGFFVRVADVL